MIREKIFYEIQIKYPKTGSPKAIFSIEEQTVSSLVLR